MSIVNSEINEGVLLQEEFVSIPVSVFEDLIRAETERDILEATLGGEHQYTVGEVMQAIQTAREKHRRGVQCIEIGVCPPMENESNEDASASENQEDPDGTEACE